MNQIDLIGWLLAGAGVLVVLSAVLVVLAMFMVWEALGYLRDARRRPFQLLERERDVNGRPRRERI